MAVCSLTGFAATPSAAQNTQLGGQIEIAPALRRDDVAGSRVESGFDPQPISVGAFLLSADASAILGFDTNILRRPDVKTDEFATITPSIRLQRPGGRTELTFTAAGQLRRFRRYTSENSEQFEAGAKAVRLLPGRSTLTGGMNFARMVEPRSTVGTVENAAEPVSYASIRANLGAEIVAGRISFVPKFEYRRDRFSDVAILGGGSADLQYRNEERILGGARLSYDLSGDFAVFAEGNYANVASPNTALAIPRDANDLVFLGGFRGTITPVLNANVALGYRQRAYADPRLLDFRGLTYTADVQWYPTPLISVRMTGGQALYNSGAVQANAINSRKIGAEVYYDFRRNLRLSATADHDWQSFRGLDTRANRTTAELRAQYRSSPHLSIGIYARYETQDVDGTRVVLPYSSFSFGVGATGSL